MNSVIETATRPFRGGPKKPEPLSQPHLLDPSKLDKLDTYRQRDWFTHPERTVADFELESTDLLDPQRQVIPNEPIVKVLVDDVLHYQVLKRHERGTLERLKAADAPKEPVLAPQLPLEFLVGNTLLTGHTQRGRFAIRGCDSIMAVYRKKGVEFYPGADPFSFEYTAAGGRLVTPYRRDLQDLAPLLAPKINTDVAPGCEYPVHSDYVEARSLREASPAPRLWCMECGLS